ncbi:hypothetical protein GCM10007933_35310 [Zoogloea oryzae]|uniref:Uncharacterized protein n=1 Tax=Zoogloea oryzae TaxID=310767 RepID=A0ABQ6FH53_9RHOO|nr:hypothetical protein GCM10007933_35310 [Zoogloea oryzae]
MGGSLGAPFSVETRQQAANVVGKVQDFGGVVQIAKHPGDLDLRGEFGKRAAGNGDEVGVLPGTTARRPSARLQGMETAARRICSVSPKRSSPGKQADSP